jgi:hypothetical protein
MRMAYGSDGYAPITIPHQFWVLEPRGDLVPMAGPQGLELDRAKTLKQASSAIDPDLRAAIDRLAKPERAAIRLVWDTVFWRRCVYFLTVVLTLWLVLFPWTWHLKAGTLDKVDKFARGPVTVVVDALSNFIPSYVQSWKQALLTHPLEFGALVAGILLCLAGSTVLEQRIHDRSRLAWHTSVASSYQQWREHIRAAWSRWLVAGLALLAVIYVAAFKFANPETLRTIAFLAGALVLVIVFRLIGYKQVDQAAARTPIRSTLALSIARFIRKNAALRWGYAFLADSLVPFMFVIALIVGALILVNRVAFDIEDSAGVYCTGTKPLNQRLASVGQSSAELKFPNDRLCWASGLEVVEGGRYLIVLKTEGDWFDKSVRADPTGFDGGLLIHKSTTLLKRRWGEKWLQPIARIGVLGNEEYAIEPIDDVAPWDKQPCPAATTGSKSVRAKIDDSTARTLMDCNATPPDRMTLRGVITARSTGELFVYVNDAVLGIPRWAGEFVANNSGTTTLTVRRLPASAVADEVGTALSQ